MSRALFTVAPAFVVVTGVAAAQGGEDALAQLRACGLMHQEERIPPVKAALPNEACC